MSIRCNVCRQVVEPAATVVPGLFACPVCQNGITGLDVWMQEHPSEEWPVLLPPKSGPKLAVQLGLFPKESVYRHISEVLGEAYDPEPASGASTEEIQAWMNRRRP